MNPRNLPRADHITRTKRSTTKSYAYFIIHTPYWHLSSSTYDKMILMTMYISVWNRIPDIMSLAICLSCLDTVNKGRVCLHVAFIDSLHFDAVGYQLPSLEKHGNSHEVAPERSDKYMLSLTHWSRVTHIYVGNRTIIVSDNGLSPCRRQAIIWTNAWILLIVPLGTNFSEISIEILIFSFKKMRLKVSSANWWPFCFGLNVLRYMHTACVLLCFIVVWSVFLEITSLSTGK